MKFLSSERLSEHKYKTPEGYLICTDAILARTGKQSYQRNEIFADAADDDTIIEIDRPSEEVFAPETLASFENKPVTVEHPDENVGPDNYNNLAVGFVRDVHKGTVNGQEVMLGTLVITDAKTIEEIENGEHTDLSCGYDCDIVDEAHPQQRNIRGNHVALCQQGRAGIARIVDSVKDAYIKKIERYGKVDIWQDEQGQLYADFTVSQSGKHLKRLNTSDINKAKKIIDNYVSFLDDSIKDNMTSREFDYWSYHATLRPNDRYKLNQIIDLFYRNGYKLFDYDDEDFYDELSDAYANASSSLKNQINAIIKDSKLVDSIKDTHDSYLIQSKYNADNYFGNDGYFHLNKHTAMRFNTYEEAAKKARALYSDWQEHVNIVNDSVKDSMPITIDKVVYKKGNYTVLEYKNNSGNTVWIVVSNNNWHGEKVYTGGGVVEFSKESAIKTANDFSAMNDSVKDAFMSKMEMPEQEIQDAKTITQLRQDIEKLLAKAAKNPDDSTLRDFAREYKYIINQSNEWFLKNKTLIEEDLSMFKEDLKDSKSYIVSYKDSDVTYIKKVKATSALDAYKKIKKSK